MTTPGGPDLTFIKIWRWLMSVLFVGIGAAIWYGWLFPQIPSQTGLRFLLGMVMILLGIYRLLSSGFARRGGQRDTDHSAENPFG